MNGILPEGTSINKPPGFAGEHYSFWKVKFKNYVKATDFGLWNVFERGDYVPSSIEDGVRVPKLPEEYDENDQRLAVLNAKAVLMLQGALNQEEFFRICNLPSAKHMWDALEIAHEGTAGVKENRMNTLMTEYDLLRMKSGETIGEFQLRFTHLINQLAALGKEYDQSVQVRKILNILTKEWEAKVTAIEEAHGVSMTSVAALFGSLSEYESKMKFRKTLEESTTKMKGIALKAITESKDSDDEEDEDSDETAMMVRRYRRYYKRGKDFKRFAKGDSSRDSKRPVICYGCEKPGHIKADCPELKNKDKEKKKFSNFKKKAYISGIWGESSSDEEEEEETANLCLVAQEEKSPEEEVLDSETSYDELLDEYNHLFTDFRKLAKELSSSKKLIKTLEEKVQNSSVSTSSPTEKVYDPSYEKLLSEYDVLQTDFENLAEKYKREKFQKEIFEEQAKHLLEEDCENCSDLKKKNSHLTKALEKFTKGSEMLNIILKEQRFTNDKSGLGYKPSFDKKKGKKKMGEKSYLNYFRKSVHSSNPFAHCNYCNRKGHSTSSCFHKKERKNQPIGNFKWVPKGTYVVPKAQTNPRGPKKRWVPKI